MRYKETHGPTNVSFPEDKSLSQFCVNARYARKNPGKGIRLTEERIAALDEIELDWTEYVTRSFMKGCKSLRNTGKLTVTST
jgi:5-methylcytosine-specific restriction endonuclease McrBC GTP-binding regulatory subunit McrB